MQTMTAHKHRIKHTWLTFVCNSLIGHGYQITREGSRQK